MSANDQVDLKSRVIEFMNSHIYPNEDLFYEQFQTRGPNAYLPVVDDLKTRAKAQGLWNFFLPGLSGDDPGTRLSNLEYAPISEELGKVSFAPEVFNCSAPDTGNMEILSRYAQDAIRTRWLRPLLEGEVRSAFSMTEPDSASSDATNIGLRIDRRGDTYVLNGRKWFTSNALYERCQVLIVMGKTDPLAPRHLQQSMIVVPKDTPGISFERDPKIFGYTERGGHPEIVYDNVEVPADNLLGDEGSGFAIAQARLGPGRIHHCMRTIGLAERALGLLIQRALSRVTFGTSLAHKGLVQDWIAESRVEIDMARSYVLRAAQLMDTVGNQEAATEIAGIKVAVPRMALAVIDRAIQVHGAGGLTQYTPLAEMYAQTRTLRLADGPDEVHKMTIARREIRRHDSAFHITPPMPQIGTP
jgi:acyl-CoA dehydrogenase